MYFSHFHVNMHARACVHGAKGAKECAAHPTESAIINHFRESECVCVRYTGQRCGRGAYRKSPLITHHSRVARGKRANEPQHTTNARCHIRPPSQKKNTGAPVSNFGRVRASDAFFVFYVRLSVYRRRREQKPRHHLAPN